MEENALTVKDLTVVLGNNRVLENLSFEVQRGETAAIIGPNGAGKTVLFKVLIGALPYHGSVAWSHDAKIGYVPQQLDLDRHLSLTLGDFLFLKAGILRLSKPRVLEIASLVHLPEEKLALPLTSLSGGELQRSLIAFALLGSPNVLLFDEPTAGIDLPGEEKIYEVLHHLQDERELTLIFISHDLNLVYRYSSKVICLNRSLFCFGSPKQTLTSEVLDKLYGARVLHHIHQREAAN